MIAYLLEVSHGRIVIVVGQQCLGLRQERILFGFGLERSRHLVDDMVTNRLAKDREIDHGDLWLDGVVEVEQALTALEQCRGRRRVRHATADATN